MVRRAERGLQPNGPARAHVEEICQINDAAAYGNDVKVKQLADRFLVSPRHLSRIFKAVTGSTIHSYVQQVRIERAKPLLISTDLPAREIAQMLGFSNASHFSAEFSRRVGCTPSQYRARAGVGTLSLAV